MTYVRPTAKLGADEREPGRRSLRRRARVRKDGKHPAPLAQLLPDQDPSKGATSRFFEGEATSEVDVRWGLRRDFWMAMRPDIGSLDKPIREADRKFPTRAPTRRRSDRAALAEQATAAIRRRDLPGDRLAAGVWIWIGGAIVLLGALVAAWPSPEARLRRVRGSTRHGWARSSRAA